jgi:hypothetical protein
MSPKMRNIGGPAVSLALLVAALVFGAAVAAAETVPPAGTRVSAQGTSSTDAEDANTTPGISALEKRVEDVVEAHGEEKCRRAGMVRYHGQCMAPEDRNILFETEIRHVESLLQEALTQYQTTDAQTLALSFREVEEFVATFQPREVMDERLAGKLILVLGYLYMPADRLIAELRNTEKTGGLFEFLDRQERLAAFSEQVHIPLMQLFGERIDDYVARYGYERFARLMRDNGLADVLEEVETESPR